MGGEPLEVGEPGGGLDERARALFGEADHARPLDEVEHPERGGEACCAPGGQHVVRANNVVAEGNGAPSSAENRAGSFAVSLFHLLT